MMAAIWKSERNERKKKTNNCYRQFKITPRARACPVAPSLKSERKRWDEKGNRELSCIVSLSNPLFCFSPSRCGHGCGQWQALVTHRSHALINWCSKTLAMICTKYSPSAAVYGNVSFVQRCWAAQRRLLQGRAPSSDLIDPSDSMSAERSAGRFLSLSELAPVSLPCAIIKSILITL